MNSRIEYYIRQTKKNLKAAQESLVYLQESPGTPLLSVDEFIFNCTLPDIEEYREARRVFLDAGVDVPTALIMDIRNHDKATKYQENPGLYMADLKHLRQERLEEQMVYIAKLEERLEKLQAHA